MRHTGHGQMQCGHPRLAVRQRSIWACVRPVCALRPGSQASKLPKTSSATKSLRALPTAEVSLAGAPADAASQTPAQSSEDERGLLERSFEAGAKQQSQGSSKGALEEEEVLASNWTHRAITGGSIVLMLALFGKGVSEIREPVEALKGAGAVLFAYYLSDFLTGVYHWGVDNYGDGATPIVGDQIAAFQGHHQKPWTITQREFCNNVHKVFKPAAPFTAACLLLSPLTPSWLDVGLATATLLTCMSQQFHAWAHMKASSLPSVVKALQDRGVLVSRKAHGAHHKAPFEGNYCIVSGAWNPILDAGGEGSFFRRLERLVHTRTGIEPRCWHEPDYSWQEAEEL